MLGDKHGQGAAAPSAPLPSAPFSHFGFAWVAVWSPHLWQFQYGSPTRGKKQTWLSVGLDHLDHLELRNHLFSRILDISACFRFIMIYIWGTQGSNSSGLTTQLWCSISTSTAGVQTTIARLLTKLLNHCYMCSPIGPLGHPLLGI